MRFVNVGKSVFVFLAAASMVACSSAGSGAADSRTSNLDGANVDAGPGDTTATDASPSPAAFCKAYCTKVNGCDKTQDLDTCQQSCVDANAAQLPKFRSDVIAGVESCIQADDCKTVLGADAVSKCLAEAGASIAPDSAATATCAALATESTKCHATFDRASCLSDAKLYNDGALANAQKCAQKACTDVDACVTAAIGQSLGGGSAAGTCDAIGPGRAFDSGSAACNTCVGSSCCAEVSACAGNASCANLWSCASTCTTQSCMDACGASYPGGVSDYNALGTCLDGASCTATSCK